MAHSNTMQVPYNQLPNEVKQEVDKLYKEFKLPLRSIISDISRVGSSYTNVHETIEKQIKRIKLDALRLQHDQADLLKDAKILLEDVTKASNGSRTFGCGGLLQIQQRSGFAWTEKELPVSFYWKALEGMNKRLEDNIGTIDGLERELHLLQQQSQLSMNGRAVLDYEYILTVMKQQSGECSELARVIGSIHEEIALLKQRFLLQYYPHTLGGTMPNPFEAADKKELALKRQMEQKLQQQAVAYPPAPPATTAAPTTAAPPAGSGGTGTSFGFGGSAGTSSFGFGAAPAATTATTGFGAVPATTGGFGTAAPAAGFGTTTGSTTGFGTTSTPGFGTAAPTATGFGTTTAPGFGSTTATGFGSTTAPGFGSTTAGGFGSTTATGFGSTTAGGFGSTTAGGFGNTPATTTSFGGSFGAPAGGLSGFGSMTQPTSTLGASSTNTLTGKKKKGLKK